MEKIVALITASGRGSRLSIDGEGIPKQYLPLAGVPMLRHTILAFLNHPQITDVICTIHPDDSKLYEESIIGLDLLNPVLGGETRQISVRNGLEALREYNPDKVLIHDGARPFTSKRVINGILEKLETHPAVIPAIAVEDTIKKYNDGKIEWTVERENLWRAQTPQGFIYDDILNAHNSFKNIRFTDDSSLDEYSGIPVAIVPGSQNNFKVTTAQDYERAKRLMVLKIDNVKEETRSGIGYDVCRFRDRKEGESKSIRIAGLDIATNDDFDKKIDTESDGDVAIHTIIDALLGAIGQGDMEEYFPATSEVWKNCDPRDMLKHVNHFLRKKGATIINIDLVIVCESLKFCKYKTQMKETLADILSISVNRINIKSITTEKLGFQGRDEGISAQGICNVKFITLDE